MKMLQGHLRNGCVLNPLSSVKLSVGTRTEYFTKMLLLTRVVKSMRVTRVLIGVVQSVQRHISIPSKEDCSYHGTKRRDASAPDVIIIQFCWLHSGFSNVLKRNQFHQETKEGKSAMSWQIPISVLCGENFCELEQETLHYVERDAECTMTSGVGGWEICKFRNRLGKTVVRGIRMILIFLQCRWNSFPFCCSERLNFIVYQDYLHDNLKRIFPDCKSLNYSGTENFFLCVKWAILSAKHFSS